jgi:hypothetical protein
MEANQDKKENYHRQKRIISIIPSHSTKKEEYTGESDMHPTLISA